MANCRKARRRDGTAGRTAVVRTHRWPRSLEKVLRLQKIGPCFRVPPTLTAEPVQRELSGKSSSQRCVFSIPITGICCWLEDVTLTGRRRGLGAGRLIMELDTREPSTSMMTMISTR